MPSPRFVLPSFSFPLFSVDNFPDPSPSLPPPLPTQLKQALQDGSVTKKDVEELEKMMGVDVKQLVKMMDSGQVDKEKLKELGSDFGELVDLFRALSKIK